MHYFDYPNLSLRIKYFQCCKVYFYHPQSFQVGVFFDTCFSGISRDEETLLVSARPLLLIDDNENKIPKNVSIFSASKLNQFSSGYAEAKHGIFSYFLMKGMEGEANVNNDNIITVGELHSYVQQNVIQQSAGSQTPELLGDANRALVRFQ